MRCPRMVQAVVGCPRTANTCTRVCLPHVPATCASAQGQEGPHGRSRADALLQGPVCGAWLTQLTSFVVGNVAAVKAVCGACCIHALPRPCSHGHCHSTPHVACSRLNGCPLMISCAASVTSPGKHEVWILKVELPRLRQGLVHASCVCADLRGRRACPPLSSASWWRMWC